MPRIPRQCCGMSNENTYITHDIATASAQPTGFVQRRILNTELSIDEGIKFNLVIHNWMHARSRHINCRLSTKLMLIFCMQWWIRNHRPNEEWCINLSQSNYPKNNCQFFKMNWEQILLNRQYAEIEKKYFALFPLHLQYSWNQFIRAWNWIKWIHHRQNSKVSTVSLR